MCVCWHTKYQGAIFQAGGGRHAEVKGDRESFFGNTAGRSRLETKEGGWVFCKGGKMFKHAQQSVQCLLGWAIRSPTSRKSAMQNVTPC